MKRRNAFFLLFFYFLCVMTAFSQESPVRYAFSKASAAENGVTVTGAGFGSLPQAEVIFGRIPTDNSFDNATDGTGMTVQADPGEGVMLLTNTISTDRCTLVRVSIRSSDTHVSVYLATIDHGQSGFVSTLTPNNGAFFAGRYNRIADVFLPPSTGFQVLVQIVNTSQTEALTAYVDNVDVIPASADRLDFAVSDLVAGSIQPIATRTPIPTGTPTPLPPTPTPQSDEPFQALTIPLPNLPAGAKPLEMVYIPAGAFTMGSPETETGRSSDEGSQHKVTLSQPFYLGRYEVTQAQWQAVMGYNPSFFKGSNLPVETVSWNNCQEYIRKLNEMNMGFFRLPTEAEWEYACRAGTPTRFYWGEDLDYSEADRYVWTPSTSLNQTHEVGLKWPNAWGLFDTSGNVWEWCQDWYGPYSAGAQINPTGPNPSGYKVIRGGCWGSNAKYSRSALRNRNTPDFGSSYGGLRLVRNP